MKRQLLDAHGPIPGMTLAQALITIQTMADHTQKWLDGSCSKNISSSSNSDEIATIISKLDNLGRDMKKLKENIHAIQVGFQLYGGPHLDKCSALLKNQLPLKDQDPGSFILSYSIERLDFNNALADLGASISIMPFSMYKCLGMGKLKPINMVIEMADNTKNSKLELRKSATDNSFTLGSTEEVDNVKILQSSSVCFYEKARRRGQVYNWETATYGKIWYDEDVYYLRSFKMEFPAIIYNDALTSRPEVSSDFKNEFSAIVYNDALATNHKISSEPLISPLDNNEIDFRMSLDKSDDEDYICI
uniref:Reverse transcriptase domain-containing protein n=1 Tax=Tanacetum cinerariifolium TaxID=118510 RepID=A0A6L2LPF9_TANCI|nr:hypothetical protein [Tanacetum cinerariifolium]